MSMIPKQTLIAMEERLSSTKEPDVWVPAWLVRMLIEAVKETSTANEQLADELDRLRRETCDRRCGRVG